MTLNHTARKLSNLLGITDKQPLQQQSKATAEKFNTLFRAAWQALLNEQDCPMPSFDLKNRPSGTITCLWSLDGKETIQYKSDGPSMSINDAHSRQLIFAKKLNVSALIDGSVQSYQDACRLVGFAIGTLKSQTNPDEGPLTDEQHERMQYGMLSCIGSFVSPEHLPRQADQDQQDQYDNRFIRGTWSQREQQDFSEWYACITKLADYAPLILRLQEHNNVDEPLAFFTEAYENRFKQLCNCFAPVRDFEVLMRAQAYMTLVITNQPINDSTFLPAFYNALYIKGAAFFKKHYANEEELYQLQSDRAHVPSLHEYMHAAAFYYCNLLLNMIDDQSRPIPPKDHGSWQQLIKLTPELEERNMFDEMYIIRTAILHTVVAYHDDLLNNEDLRESFLSQGHTLMSELYT